ncbi:hypothetical protein HHI36_020288 [Cryptolaemus montrouzieri]|uniref:HORMA domain-containing protein n=1 Tax=Cryptolaemus montrouzieri TaxID=559131 RepID=A0ABD2NAA5_9CUCU
MTKKYNSVPFKVFNNNSVGVPIVQLYRKWTKGFKDSFDKKYLKQLVLFIVNDETNDIEESFKFSFRYENQINKENADKDLTSPTENLLRGLLSLGDMPKLDVSKLSLNVELFYFDDTPEEYSPPFFETKDYNSTMLSRLGKDGHDSLGLARLSTGFHYFACFYRKKMTNSQRLEDSEKVVLKSARKKNKRKHLASTGDISRKKPKKLLDAERIMMEVERESFLLSESELIKDGKRSESEAINTFYSAPSVLSEGVDAKSCASDDYSLLNDQDIDKITACLQSD